MVNNPALTIGGSRRCIDSLSLGPLLRLRSLRWDFIHGLAHPPLVRYDFFIDSALLRTSSFPQLLVIISHSSSEEYYLYCPFGPFHFWATHSLIGKFVLNSTIF